MIKNVYAVRDVKGEVFKFPHFDITHGEAIRAFSDLVRNDKSPFHSHPNDYSLYHLGEFDDCQGILIPLRIPIFISAATEHSSREMANATNGG